jgi:hypothetical protein
MGLRRTSMQACPECGVWVQAHTLHDRTHACDPETRIEYQVALARKGLDHLEADLERHASTPRAQRLLAFRHYVERRDARYSRHAA